MSEEKNIVIQSVNDEAVNQDLFFQFEKALILIGKPDLIGLVLSLSFLNQIGYIHFKTQKQLAQIIGFSEPAFIKKRKELEDIGIIEVVEVGTRRTLNLKFLSRLKFFKLPLGYKEQLEYLETAALSLCSEEIPEGQLSLTQLKNFKSSIIYKYNTLLNKSNNNPNKKNINTKDIDINNIVNIDHKKTFPKEDYNLVLDAFKKYKGVGLAGPEVSYHLRAIKLMFQAGRTPKQIIDFMKWLHDNESNEEAGWVKTWTIWTVQKKIPEFVAGKLKTVNNFDEDYPDA